MDDLFVIRAINGKLYDTDKAYKLASYVDDHWAESLYETYNGSYFFVTEDDDGVSLAETSAAKAGNWLIEDTREILELEKCHALADFKEA